MLDNASLGKKLWADRAAGQARANLKGDTEWGAFGFDPSAMDIADPWAKRNVWF